jgi:LEA14-like dessication related protein
LVDWHVSGFWVINCPVAWIRVTNYNNVPIKEIELKYFTYNYDGQKLDEGKYTIEGTVGPHSVKNFIEQYVGLVDLHSEKFSVQLESVSATESNH